eukprot:jgi/Psemu1/69037/estExt_Genemark1.C_6820002
MGDSLCVENYREGSYCTPDGLCSNPFRSGCLRNVLPQNYTKVRTCNSEDDERAEARGECAASPFDYEEDYEALRSAVEYGDCKSFQADRKYKGLDYRSCAHVMTEAWNGQKDQIETAEREGLIEPSTGSAERYPIILSHFGMTAASEIENRRLMADIFLPPEYDDQGRLIAARAPSDESEELQYFSADLFHGHFSASEENDCDANPFSCRGHLSNVQCDWSTFAIPQAYYHGIPVTGSGPGIAGGYPYTSMVEIYQAANYTKSDVLFYWFTPDATMQEYLGTDAEFERILLSPSTEECKEARVTEDQRCSSHPKDHIGKEVGSCDSEAHSVQKLIVANMYERTYKVDSTFRTPAYDAVKSFMISDLQIEELFRRWYERNNDRWSYDAREAVCLWAGENIETLLRFIPRSHPRSIREEKQNSPSLQTAMSLSVFSGILVVITTAITYYYRKKKVIVYAQPQFLYLLLLGLLFVSFGSILSAATPSEATCVAREWFILLGYSLELVPLIVKVAAINLIYQSAIKFKRVKLEQKRLFITVGVIISAVVIYLTIWTIIDPSTRQSEKVLTTEFNEENGQVIEMRYMCSSQLPFWSIIAYIYQFLLLVAGTVLAVQTRNVKQEYNESTLLGIVIYAHFVFVLLRSLTWVFRSALGANMEAVLSSFLLT